MYDCYLYRVSFHMDCLPWSVCKHCPVVISQTFTVESALPETRMLSLSSRPLVRDWCPIRVCRHLPFSTSQTRIDVSRDPLTICTPSNWKICRLCQLLEEKLICQESYTFGTRSFQVHLTLKYTSNSRNLIYVSGFLAIWRCNSYHDIPTQNPLTTCFRIFWSKMRLIMPETDKLSTVNFKLWCKSV